MSASDTGPSCGGAPPLEHIRETFAPVLRKGGASKAIVFGSHARGEADRYSDLDLIIVAESDRPFLQRDRDFPGLYDVWRGGIDMLIYTADEIERMVAGHNPFIEQALEEGVIIYEE